MPSAVTHRLTNEFDDHNFFLQAALGLASLSRRLPMLLDRHAPRRAARPAAPDREADAFVHFLLGLLSVSTTVRSHLEGARPPRRRRPPSAARVAVVPRALLV